LGRTQEPLGLDGFLVRGLKDHVKKIFKIFYYRRFFSDRQDFFATSVFAGVGLPVEVVEMVEMVEIIFRTFCRWQPLPPASTLGFSAREGFAENISTISSLSVKCRKHRRLYRWR